MHEVLGAKTPSKVSLLVGAGSAKDLTTRCTGQLYRCNTNATRNSIY